MTTKTTAERAAQVRAALDYVRTQVTGEVLKQVDIARSILYYPPAEPPVEAPPMMSPDEIYDDIWLPIHYESEDFYLETIHFARAVIAARDAQWIAKLGGAV